MRIVVLTLSCFLSLSLFAQSNEKISTKKELTIQERGSNKVLSLEGVVGVLEPSIKINILQLYTSMYNGFIKATDSYESRVGWGKEILKHLTPNQILKLKEYQEQRYQKYKDFLEEHPEHFWNRKSLNYDVTTL